MSEDVKAEPLAETKQPTFGPEIDLFCKHLDAIGDVLVSTVLAVHQVTSNVRKRLTDFEEANCTVEVDADGQRTVKIPYDKLTSWRKLHRRYEHFLHARQLFPRSLLVSLISQYDAYLGRLLRTAFVRKPEILNSSEKKISFDSLTRFESIQAAREFILEKEVESILRSSHAEQFKWMENAFSVTLTKDLQVWPEFIELTERRNLFVHTDGVVSSQYMSVCKQHACAIDEGVKEGERLHVPPEYFENAHRCMAEIGIKLGHVLWRKLLPSERKEADSHLVRTTYELIEQGRLDLAIALLDFACDAFKKFESETTRLTLLVNRAQAYKWKGNNERCKKLMKSEDWSAKSDDYRLADAVLAEDWTKSAKIMRRIGKDGSVEKHSYRDWPLFRDFRKQALFLDTYSEVFGEPFASSSEVKKTAEPLLTSEYTGSEVGQAQGDMPQVELLRLEASPSESEGVSNNDSPAPLASEQPVS